MSVHGYLRFFNECQLILQKDKRWKYINLNPPPPVIRGLIKIHKEDSSIRPIVNWKNAPAYRLAEMLSEKLGIYIPLPYTFNVKNTVHLLKDLMTKTLGKKNPKPCIIDYVLMMC
jgi:hypothetical protein